VDLLFNFGGFTFNMGSVGFFWFVQLVLQVVLSTWAYKDARKRGSSKEFAIVVMIGVLLVPLAGAIVYFLIRDDI
jgi:ABC-type transport system involved in multi-copper enzyme maturation permease subunit